MPMNTIDADITEIFRKNLVHFQSAKDDPDLIQKWQTEAAEHYGISIDRVAHAFAAALEQAANASASATQTSSLSSTKPKSMSFSLDQLLNGSGGGGAFALPVTWDQVQEIAPSANTAARLTVLQKVAYMDDVLHDWDDFRQCLLEGLSRSGDDKNNDSKCNSSSSDIIGSYMDLHETWFGLARKNHEFSVIQSGLVENLLQFIVVDTKNNGDSEVASDSSWLRTRAQKLVHAMWTDWMIRRQIVETSVEASILESLLHWTLSSSSSSNDQSSSSIIRNLDPHARWYQLWISQQSARRILNEKSFLSSNSILARTVQDVVSNRNESSTTWPPLSAIETCALCITCDILTAVRPGLFPWDDFSVTRQEFGRLLRSIIIRSTSTTTITTATEDDNDNDNNEFQSIVQYALELLG